MIVRMWEVKAHPEGFDDLLGWVCDAALPALEVDPRHAGSEVFSAPDHRIIVICRWRGSEPLPLPEPPGYLVAVKPYWSDFAPVDR